MTAPFEIPRLVLGAASSGSGKTTLAVALLAALRGRGLRVAAFKCGPDYLDLGYHARAAGAPSHNLDGWMMGRDGVLATFASAVRGADVAIVEGVMGLHDGASPASDAGSTAEIARWLEAPVAIVLDASGMARTAAAVAGGLAGFDPRLRVAALVCNRVGSRGHLELLREAVAAPPVVGGLPARADLAFPERHLGLVTASRRVLPDDRVAAWARLAEEWLDVDALLAAARAAPPLALPDPAPSPRVASRCRIGVAHDEAFHFYYEDNLARLEALGATLVRFSPLHDAGLPDVDGLYLGGGYPEEHAPALAANVGMLRDVRALAASGRPVYAECGGLMALAAAIRTRDGRVHAGVGLLPGTAIVHERLQALGYVEVTTRAPSLAGPAGARFRGHQFRYSELAGVPDAVPRVYAVARRRGEPLLEGYAPAPNVLASYVHAHWASCPAVAEALVGACAATRGGAR
ncbi:MULTISPECIES: cobyrinate a,c-diamide synthase [Anaeromyxobacter]|uniref:cobyrinate a,c-diamide synthase n=1 Tax=Anaeromyxobacter TaxID=161492 RepID=UPI001F591669|nr:MULTISPECIES: cobyrinate a,c-diamide synthase [unclassified Anaeromyxobacter]